MEVVLASPGRAAAGWLHPRSAGHFQSRERRAGLCLGQRPDQQLKVVEPCMDDMQPIMLQVTI